MCVFCVVILCLLYFVFHKSRAFLGFFVVLVVLCFLTAMALVGNGTLHLSSLVDTMRDRRKNWSITNSDNLNLKNERTQSKKLSLGAQQVLKKAVVTPDFEKLECVPPYQVSKRKLQQERRKEREKTKGKKWFGLPATEMTEEIKQDLEILQMRSVLDPKHFYKKNDLKVLPKYFQVGKVMDSPLDFYNNRLTKKERKKTLVDELLADVEFQRYNKRKYKDIIEEKQKTHYKSWRKAKQLKRKKQ